MSGRTWTTEELVGLVDGAVIVARDLRAQAVRLPSAFTEVAQPDPRAWEAQLGQEHPADLGVVIDAWWRAVAEPGSACTVRARRRLGAAWFLHDITCLNLTHQHEFGFVLTIARRLGEPLDLDEPAVNGSDAAFTAPATIVQHLDELGIVLRTEGDVERVFGVPPRALEGEAIVDHLHPDDLGAAASMWLEVLSSPDSTRTIQQRVVRPDGSVCWIQSTVMNRLASSSSVLSVSHDIGPQRTQQQALTASLLELRFLTDEVPVGVFRGASDGDLSFTNGRFAQLLGDVTSIDGLARALAEESAENLRAAWNDAASQKTTVVVTVLHADERHLEFRLHGVAAVGEGADGVIGTVDDVTADVTRTAQLEASARLDPLTGLSNRRGVEAALRSPVNDRRQLVVFADLDGFKAINDRHGHDAGDAVLQIIAGRLRDAVRPGDLVSRWGGDEFVVVCHDVPEGGDAAVVSRLEDAFSDPVSVDDQTHEVAVSLGAVWSEANESASGVLQRADEAMYEAKRRRRR